jgi:hypothetical protein
MTRPSLISEDIREKFYQKKEDVKKGRLTEKVSWFLVSFLIGGVVLIYYKYLTKNRIRSVE